MPRWNHVMTVAAAAVIVCIATYRAHAGTICISISSFHVYSIPSMTPFDGCTAYAVTTDGATEGYGYGDVDLSTPGEHSLQLYTHVDGHMPSTDARPLDTSGWHFWLGVKGFVPDDEILILDHPSIDLTLADNSGFEGKEVWFNGWTQWPARYLHESLSDEGHLSFYPPAEASHDGDFFDFTIDVQNVPEPATLSLLALGGLAMMGRRRK